MTPNTSPNPSAAPANASPANHKRPRDFSELARRISSRTTDLLAVALVTVLLLFLAVQATRWWRDEPSRITASVPAPLAAWNTPSGLSLQFTTGNWSLRRENVAGDESRITELAINRTRSTLDAASVGSWPPIETAEQQWLDRLNDWPIHERSERGDISVLGGPWPWVIATTGVAPSERRIAGWAFALPQSDNHWTLYVAERTTDQPSQSAASDDLPLPTAAARVFGIRAPTGGFVSFDCAANRLTCQSDWDRRLTAAGWTRSGDWLTTDQHSRATFVRPHSGHTDRLQVLLSDAEDHGTTGAVDWLISPEQPEAP